MSTGLGLTFLCESRVGSGCVCGVEKPKKVTRSFTLRGGVSAVGTLHVWAVRRCYFEKTVSECQLDFSRFSPHAFPLGEKTEVFSAEGSPSCSMTKSQG